MLRKYRNQLLIGLLLIFVIYAGLLLFADGQGYFETEGLLEALRNFAWWLVVPTILLQMMVIFFRFVEWHYYLGVVDARDKISLSDSLIIFVSVFTMVLSPGKAAELLKVVFLKAKTGIALTRSAPIPIAERVVDGLAVVVIMTLTLLFAGNQLNLGTYGGVDYNLLSRTVVFSSAFLLLGGLVVIQIEPLARLCLTILKHIPFLGRLYQPLTDFYESSREIFSLRHVIPMTMVGLGVYIPSIIGFVVILYGLGLEVTWQLVLQAAFILGATSAIGAFSFVPNGAGVTELTATGMLLALVAPLQPELTPTVAVAAALLQSFFHKWFRVFLGLGVGIVFRNRLFSEDLENIFAEAEAFEQRKRAIPQAQPEPS